MDACEISLSSKKHFKRRKIGKCSYIDLLDGFQASLTPGLSLDLTMGLFASFHL
jgi:hypothetical protein